MTPKKFARLSGDQQHDYIRAELAVGHTPAEIAWRLGLHEWCVENVAQQTEAAETNGAATDEHDEHERLSRLASQLADISEELAR